MSVGTGSIKRAAKAAENVQEVTNALQAAKKSEVKIRKTAVKGKTDTTKQKPTEYKTYGINDELPIYLL